MSKTRSGAAKLNFITGLAYEFVVIVFGLIVPRIVLSYFGSDYNGLLNSVVQFMSFSVVLQSGLGAVTNAALFKPLAENNLETISGIMVATDRFMRKIGWLLAGIIVVFALLYPLLVIDEFSYWFSFTLILIVGAASWVENMFSIKYKILLQADQKHYVQTFVMLTAHILSNALAVVLIVAGFNIHIVRLGMLLGLMTTPFMLKIYVNRHYTIDWTQPPNNVAIKSRWDAFAQQAAMIANNNIPTIMITLLLPLKEVSVYTVYQMVVKNIKQLLTTSLGGFSATFGNMYAKGEKDHLRKRFRDLEWLIFASCAVLYGVTGILLTPFILIYTAGVTDAEYNRFWFGILMTFTNFVYITRMPYRMITEAVGCFKETRNSAIWEIVLNIVVALIFVPFMGLGGVLIGTLIGAIVRTGNLIWICCRKILDISLWSVVKNYIVYLGASVGLAILATQWIDFTCVNFGQWILVAIPVTIAVSVVVLCVSVLFNRKQLMGILSSLLRRKRK